MGGRQVARLLGRGLAKVFGYVALVYLSLGLVAAWLLLGQSERPASRDADGLIDGPQVLSMIAALYVADTDASPETLSGIRSAISTYSRPDREELVEDVRVWLRWALYTDREVRAAIQEPAVQRVPIDHSPELAALKGRFGDRGSFDQQLIQVGQLKTLLEQLRVEAPTFSAAERATRLARISALDEVKRRRIEIIGELLPEIRGDGLK
jgi:hypothetical protein